MRTVVVLRALGLGDFLTGVPALRALADAFPDHRRLLAAPVALAPLARLCGAVDEVVDTSADGVLDASLHGADVGVDLHGRGPESHRRLLAAGPRRLIAFRHAEVHESEGMPEWRPDEHEVERWCRLLREHGLDGDPSRLELRRPPLVPHRRFWGATLIHPGAASPARRWPAERWAEVAAHERRHGRTVVVTGSADEREAAEAVAARAGVPAADVVAGRTSLLELAALVAASGRVVCGDTGVAHLATAYSRPSVLLFGPVPPSQWGPPGGSRLHRVLWHGTTGDPHGATVDEGLLRIRVGDVIDALASLERDRNRRSGWTGWRLRRGARTRPGATTAAGGAP